MAPLVALVTQGITPEKLALSVALGAILGVFPIIGSGGLLCLLVGVLLRLNQPALQLVNLLVYPLQFVLLLSFVRLGEMVVGVAPVSLTLAGISAELAREPASFLRGLGMTTLHAMLGWLVSAPFVAAILYAALMPLLRRSMARRRQPLTTPPITQAS